MPQPKHRILEEHPTISADLLNQLGHGEIAMKPNVVKLAGDCVDFADGSSEEIDVIVYATGYDITFPFLNDDLMQVTENSVRLYRRVVHPRHKGLFFIGLIQPWGAIMPLAEEQAKWVADLVDRQCGLPTVPDMEREIDAHEQKLQRRYVKSTRHTIQVDFFDYLDAIRNERIRAKRFPAIDFSNNVDDRIPIDSMRAA